MKRIAVATVLSLGLAALAAAASSSAAHMSTIRLMSTQTSFAVSPSGPPNVGSTMIFTNAVYNGASQFGKAKGARIGTSEGVCTIVSHSRAQCTITAHLPNGEIVVGGAMTVSARDISHTTYAITGGAGAYAGARGTVTARDVSPTRSLIELHLLG